MQALIPEIGSVVIAAGLLIVIALLWTKPFLDLRTRILRTITGALWSALYLVLELFLVRAAVAGTVSGAMPAFVLASACVCAAAVSSLARRVRELFSRLRSSRSEDVSSEMSSGARPAWFQTALHAALAFVAIAGVSLACFLFLEVPSNPEFMALSRPYLACEMSIIGGIVLGSWFICQRRPIGLIAPMAVSLVYGFAEHFVEVFKSSAITPSDLRSFQTGLRVAGGYEYEITTIMLLLIALFAVTAALLVWLPDPLARFLGRAGRVRENACRRRPGLIKNTAAICASLCVGMALVVVPVSNALARDWQEEGVAFDYWDLHLSVDAYGLIPSLVAALQFEDITPPDGYGHEEAEGLQAGLANLYDRYIEATDERQAASGQFAEIQPNVIVVMNESFSDLSFLDGLGVDYKGPDFLGSTGAIAQGNATVGVLGGGTCNSEFEALTGVSLGYVGGGYIPYAVCDMSAVDTMPRQFKALGYDTVAMHPELATNWSRDKVYPAMGFDEFIDINGFEGAERVRDHVRDSEVYDKALARIVESDAPQFIFGLTMMGHGGYDTGLIPEEESVGYDLAGTLDDGLAAEVNEYLSSIGMSDRDLLQFVQQLKRLDEPTVLVFFGDHQPGISTELQEAIHGDSDDIASWEELYQTEYLIWANYDIAGSAWMDRPSDVLYDGTMPTANLMSWAMSFIGAPMSTFDKASYMSREWVQSNNIFAYLDTAAAWQPMSEAETLEGLSTFTEGMQIIGDCLEGGLPASETGDRLYQGAVMVNVMKWITYLNFVEVLG